MAFTARTETYVNVSSLTTPFNFTLNKPTGTVDNDILFTFLCIQATTPPTVDSVPAGWNLIATRLVGTAYRFYLYYKIASGEGANWTWSLTATCKLRAVCSCYTSGDYKTSGTIIDVISDSEYIQSDNILRAASMNVTYANSPLVFFGGVYNTSSRTFTKPTVPTSDWVEDDDAGSTTPDWWTTVCSMIWAGSGATGDMDDTISTSDAEKHAFAIALRPAIVTTTSPYSIDTILQKIGMTIDYSSDVVLQSLNQMSPYSTDVAISKANQIAQYLIDTAQMKETTKDFIIDTLLKADNVTMAYLLDVILSVLAQEQTIDYLVDVLLRFTDTKAYFADVLLTKADETKPYDIDAILQKRDEVKAYITDVILVNAQTKAYFIDAVLMKPITAEYLIDVSLFGSSWQVYIIDTLIQKTETKTYLADALLKKLDIVTIYTIDALLSKINTSNYLIDVVSKKMGVTSDYFVDTALKGTTVQSYLIDVFLGVSTPDITKSYLIDAIFVNTQVKQYILDTILHKLDISRQYLVDVLLGTEIFVPSGMVHRRKQVFVDYEFKIPIGKLSIVRKTEKEKTVQVFTLINSKGESINIAKIEPQKPLTKDIEINESLLIIGQIQKDFKVLTAPEYIKYYKEIKSKPFLPSKYVEKLKQMLDDMDEV
jgi:hypothetical protein